jgi:hypothetical protein
MIIIFFVHSNKLSFANRFATFYPQGTLKHMYKNSLKFGWRGVTPVPEETNTQVSVN